jgi:predicted RNA-binding protein Jag
MITIEKSGAKVEELIAEFRKEYGLKDWEFKYEIIKNPSSGLFGLLPKKMLWCVFYC